ncbi:MAG: ShlB/FhaC/HecB family hemolysin secretion/activation protein [Parachlamydiales bacterium]|jgi:hemolysin activation/secretion protein
MKRFTLFFFIFFGWLVLTGAIDVELERRSLEEEHIENELKNLKEDRAFFPEENSAVKELDLKKTPPKKDLAKEKKPEIGQTKKESSKAVEKPGSSETGILPKASEPKAISADPALLETDDPVSQDRNLLGASKTSGVDSSKEASPSLRQSPSQPQIKEPTPSFHIAPKAAPESSRESEAFKPQIKEPGRGTKSIDQEPGAAGKKESSSKERAPFFKRLDKGSLEEDLQKDKAQKEAEAKKAAPKESDASRVLEGNKAAEPYQGPSREEKSQSVRRQGTLQGLIFIKDMQKLVADPSIYPNGIILKDMWIAEEETFVETMKKFLGQPITTDLLLAVKEKVVRHYWNTGGPLIRVFVPAAQDISSGKIQFFIRRSTLGALKVNAGANTPKEKIENEISVKPGDEIFTGDLLDDKAWLENDPFRSVDIVYEPGELLGTTDIIVGVGERSPIRFYSGLEISSYKTASTKRYKVGFSKGHLYNKKTEHQVNAEITLSPYVHRWNSFTANYVIPLPRRQRLKFFGSYVRTKPQWWEINMSELMRARGVFYSLGTRYEMRLKHRGFYFHLWQFGYDFKRSMSFLDFQGQIIVRTIDVSQFLLRYEGAYKQKRGSTNLGLSLYYSPGHMSAFNGTKQYGRNRQGAKCMYFYGIFNLDHFADLPNKLTLINNLIAQATYVPLIGLEELALGGRLTVRGYNESEAVGDYGLLLKNELRTPPLKLVRAFKDSLQILAFIDFGYLNHVNPSVLSAYSTVLLSCGPGFRYRIYKYVDVRFDLGFQLKPVHGRLFGKPLKRHGHLGAYLTF